MNKESSKLLKNSTIYAIGDIIPRLMSFLTFPILTLYLTPEDYGIINYVNTFNSLLLILGFLSLNTYYLVHYYKQENEYKQKRLLGTLSSFVTLINIVAIIVLCFIGYFAPNLISSKVSFYPYLFIGIFTNFFTILTVLPSALYRVKENPLPLTVLNVLRCVIYAVCTVILVSNYEFRSKGVLTINLVITFTFSLLFLFMTKKDTIWCLDISLIKKGLIFSLPLLPGTLAYFLISMSDRFFIERYLDLSQLGIYSTASTLAFIVNIITQGAYKAFEPYFFKIYGTNDFNDKFTKVFNYYTFAILFGCLCISLFSQEFFRLFASEKYQTVYYYVPLIQIGVYFSSISLILATITTVQGRTKLNSIFTIIGGFVSVFINFTFMPLWGLSTACISSAISCGSILCLYAYFSKIKVISKKLYIFFLLVCIIIFVMVYYIQWDNIVYSIITKSATVIIVLLAMMKTLKLKYYLIKR